MKTEHIAEQYVNLVQYHICPEAISLEEIRDKTKKRYYFTKSYLKNAKSKGRNRYRKQRP